MHKNSFGVKNSFDVSLSSAEPGLRQFLQFPAKERLHADLPRFLTSRPNRLNTKLKLTVLTPAEVVCFPSHKQFGLKTFLC